MRNMASILSIKANLNPMDDTFRLCKGDTKPFTTIDEQIEKLQSRGLIINDVPNAKDILTRTNYYRLSGYSLTLRNNDVFFPGTSFDQLYEIYRFDDAFRIIILNYSSYIEIAFRSYVSHLHAGKYGPLGYMDPKNFESPERHAEFLAKLTEEVKRSDDIFAHYHKTMKGCVFPIWAAIECSSFGDLSKMYKNMKKEDRMEISKSFYGISREYAENWLQAIVIARNIAAHCGRFYNRRLRSVKLKLPDKLKQVIDSDSAFAVFYAIYRLQPTKALANSLLQEIQNIFEKYSNPDIKQLGFPENWMSILQTNSTKYGFVYQNEL